MSGLATPSEGAADRSLVEPVETPEGSSTARTRLRTVLVVVPAHNEEERVRACLSSISVARSALMDARPELTVTATLVLDSCTDGTAAAVAGLRVDLVSVRAGCVGGARRAGIRHAVERLGPCDPREVLVVNTDADCIVPATWLIQHLELAESADLVLGEVFPDPSEMSAVALQVWRLRHPVGRGSLHGANMGFRLDAYLLAGGFLEVTAQEDLFLVRAMRADRATVVGGSRVMTSARREGRVPAGFSGYLRSLDRELALLTGTGQDEGTDPAQAAAWVTDAR